MVDRRAENTGCFKKSDALYFLKSATTFSSVTAVSISGDVFLLESLLQAVIKAVRAIISSNE